jgi:hypothetical protein
MTSMDVDRDATPARTGYLSLEGPATLRWTMYEAAHNASRGGSPDHADFTAVKNLTTARCSLARPLSPNTCTPSPAPKLSASAGSPHAERSAGRLTDRAARSRAARRRPQDGAGAGCVCCGPEARTGFTFTVLEPVTGDVIGCVYLYPTESADADVTVQSWVQCSHAELDVPLADAVAAWLAAEWPWKRVHRSGR